MTKTLIALAIACGSVIPAAASNNRVDELKESPFSQIANQAGAVVSEAREISRRLKDKNSDTQAIYDKLMLVEEHANEVHRLIAETAASAGEWSPAQRSELEKMKTLADLMKVFVDNKKKYLAENAGNRSLLRAKADGIAHRAELVQKSALRLRS